MIRIRLIYNSILPLDKDCLKQVQEIFRKNFAAVAKYADKIPDMLDNPFKYGYTSKIFISQRASGNVTGFALVLHFPEINSSLLDFIAIRKDIRGGGIGSALFEAVRDYLKESGSRGLYMEVLPDDPNIVKDPQLLKENQLRFKFYEQYGIRPITGTEFETPIGGDPAPYLMFDDLGKGKPLGRSDCRAAVRLILKRKYSHLVNQDYIERVVESIIDEPVRVREPKYIKPDFSPPAKAASMQKHFALIFGARHELHHVRDKGYVERPARVGVLRKAAEAAGLFDSVPLKHFGESYIKAVHDKDFVNYLRTVCTNIPESQSVYPYVFPIRRPERKPKELAVRAGYYCIDTFTPLSKNAYQAASQAADIALSGAEETLKGRRTVYALCRPPGHHAEKRSFGGFCYFNNAAIAAELFSKTGKTATLDIDFHHGNGTQNIFYDRNDVLTVSIHGHPNFAYPYFSGFADEKGAGAGLGFNYNFPLPENASEPLYLQTLEKAIRIIEKFQPTFLVVSLGFDTMKGDPTGTFGLTAGSLRKIGGQIGQMRLPTLIVQEGGYSLKNLRAGCTAFFNGIAESFKIELREIKK
ncbi:MAG: GNAT family N-acetyltransferase [Phycisphaerae bacterium]|nr:GNAT family N-acetyltransferase [Phycisphaerae bacterium]